jgi:phosphate transport system substrate-binding protein
MIKKRVLMFFIVAALSITTACGNSAQGASNGTPGTNADQGTDSAAVAVSGSINVVSREDGSGTRSAFVELFEVRDQDGNDITVQTAEITNNTAVMITSVQGDTRAIGYISLGSLNDTVKAVQIDGVEATAANVANKSYSISRPFNIAIGGQLSPSAQDFVNYILSSDGQAVIEGGGYVKISENGPYSGSEPTAKITVSGSSSVSPAMETLKEAYLKIYPKADIEIQTSDSSTGMNDVINGISEIGMASRALKDSEIEKGLRGITIAMDGIAVIVNKGNGIESMNKEQVKDIFTGNITKWEEL